MVTPVMTAEQRVKKARTRRDNRAGVFQARASAASTGLKQLGVACDFLRAVAADLPEEEARDLALEVMGMANRRNRL